MSFEEHLRPRKGKPWRLATNLDVCPHCGAAPDMPCRDTSRRLTPPHQGRTAKTSTTTPARRHEEGTYHHQLDRNLDSAGAGAAELRAYCLSCPQVRVSDLQHRFRLSYSVAARSLEELEALRMLGSVSLGGLRLWGVSLPVDEERVAMLRKVFGWLRG